MKYHYLFIAMLSILAASTASARPERVKPGISYYSSDSVVKDGVSDIAAEKNYEEVYKDYEYFEAQYNEEGKVVLFRHYKRGEVVLEERYVYHTDGKPASKTVARNGKTPETITYGH